MFSRQSIMPKLTKGVILTSLLIIIIGNKMLLKSVFWSQISELGSSSYVETTKSTLTRVCNLHSSSVDGVSPRVT